MKQWLADQFIDKPAIGVNSGANANLLLASLLVATLLAIPLLWAYGRSWQLRREWQAYLQANPSSDTALHTAQEPQNRSRI